MKESFAGAPNVFVYNREMTHRASERTETTHNQVLLQVSLFREITCCLLNKHHLFSVFMSSLQQASLTFYVEKLPTQQTSLTFYVEKLLCLTNFISLIQQRKLDLCSWLFFDPTTHRKIGIYITALQRLTATISQRGRIFLWGTAKDQFFFLFSLKL